MTSLSDSLEPQNSKMLVRPDVRSRVVRGVELPENVIDQVRARSGRIISVGLAVRPFYKVGMRILYPVNAATTAGIDEKGELDILDDSEVSAVTDGEEEGEPDEEWIDHLIPPLGMLLVERDQRQERIGNVVVPIGYKERVRSARAVVLSGAATGFSAGEWVMLSAGAVRSFTLDALSTRQIVRISPGQILCKIKKQTEHELAAQTNTAGIREDVLLDADLDSRFDAGDQRGPR